MPSYEEIRNAVFYAHQKPDELAKIIHSIVNPSQEEEGGATEDTGTDVVPEDTTEENTGTDETTPEEEA